MLNPERVAADIARLDTDGVADEKMHTLIAKSIISVVSSRDFAKHVGEVLEREMNTYRQAHGER